MNAPRSLRAVAARRRRRELLASAAARPEPTRIVGRWQLLASVSSGPRNEVFLARAADAPAESPGRYALKLLRSGEEWQRTLAAREAELGMRVAHPHVAPVLESQLQRTPAFLVMPWVEGATLAGLLRRRGTLPAAEALWYARQTAEALAAIHELGWLHGDVKPGNVIVGPSGHVTLVDLEFARPWGYAACADALVGSAAYLPPEAFSRTLRCDARSDLYGLGVVLYEMLSGTTPYSGASFAELAERIRCGAPRALRAMAADVPREVDELVRRLLAREPLRRGGDAAEVAREIGRMEVEAFGLR